MYEGEAMIPMKISLFSARVLRFLPAKNEELMIQQLDSLEEHRGIATNKLAEYQQRLAHRYNQDVKSREFHVKDLVLRKAVGNARDTNAGKLAPYWEGMYKVIAIARAYYLEDMDERPLPRPWNVQNLRKFYH